MIVVIGPISLRGTGAEAVAAGLTARVAAAAAAAGARVEVIARIGDDPQGDELLLALARASVGHVAVSRDPAHPTVALPIDDIDGDVAAEGPDASPVPDESRAPTLDPADVGLALRYLTDFRVAVVVHPPSDGILAEVVGAASWAGAHVVALLVPDDPPAAILPPDSLVVAVLPSAAEDVGGLIGHYAAAVDLGGLPDDAFAALRVEADVR
jgi:hypothetical protein